MSSQCLILVSFMLVLGHVSLPAQGRSSSYSEVTTPQKENHQVIPDIVYASPLQLEDGTNEFLSQNQTEINDDLEEDRNLEISPSFYHTMFGNSIRSLQNSMSLLYSTNTTTAAGIYSRHGHLMSMAISVLASLGSGLAAFISAILVPLRVANQILAIIAIAVLAVYVIEDKQALHYLAGTDYNYQRDPIYSSYGYNGASSLYRNDMFDEEEGDNEPGLGEEEVLREEVVNEGEEQQTGTFSGYRENANAIRDLLSENNRIDDANREADFAYRYYGNQYNQRAN